MYFVLTGNDFKILMLQAPDLLRILIEVPLNKTGSNIWSGNMDDDEERRTSSAYF